MTSPGAEPPAPEDKVTSWQVAWQTAEQDAWQNALDDQLYAADVDGAGAPGRRTIVPWEDELSSPDIIAAGAESPRGEAAVTDWEDEFSVAVPRRARNRR
jgi:hypothetical protein